MDKPPIFTKTFVCRLKPRNSIKNPTKNKKTTTFLPFYCKIQKYIIHLVLEYKMNTAHSIYYSSPSATSPRCNSAVVVRRRRLVRTL